VLKEKRTLNEASISLFILLRLVNYDNNQNERYFQEKSVKNIAAIGKAEFPKNRQ
jgi:hypothetical protein